MRSISSCSSRRFVESSRSCSSATAFEKLANRSCSFTRCAETSRSSSWSSTSFARNSASSTPLALPARGRHNPLEMSSSELPDLDQIAMRLVQLRHRAQDLARLLERAEERHYQYPSEHSQKTLDDLRAEDASLRAEIAEHEETIRPLLRRPEDP